ncbi:MAG: single-stranded DNA-binding protein [Tissierellia bacterium]|nr:single-stranded DNA-binding protein [Tissierellia bacterium]
MNVAVLIGRLTRDPELRYLPGSGTAVARFTLAVDKQLSRDKKMELEAKNQPTADFINITVWGRQAENCAQFLVKGRLVGVHGRIQSGSYEAKDGTKRYTTEVVASQVEFLEWGDGNRGGQGGARSQGYAPSPQNDFPGGPGVDNGLGDIDGFYPIDDQNDDIPF